MLCKVADLGALVPLLTEEALRAAAVLCAGVGAAGQAAE